MLKTKIKNVNMNQTIEVDDVSYNDLINYLEQCDEIKNLSEKELKERDFKSYEEIVKNHTIDETLKILKKIVEKENDKKELLEYNNINKYKTLAGKVIENCRPYNYGEEKYVELQNILDLFGIHIRDAVERGKDHGLC